MEIYQGKHLACSKSSINVSIIITDHPQLSDNSHFACDPDFPTLYINAPQMLNFKYQLNDSDG